MSREVVQYHRGRAPVRRPPVTRLDVLKADTEEWRDGAPVSEIWQGPEQELRARLRDEVRDRRVKAYGDVIPRQGLPRGWVAMRVYLTERELSRTAKAKPRVPRAACIAAAIVAILTGVASLGYWIYLQLAAAVAGIAASAWVGGGLVVALILAAGGTTVVTVVTQVTIRRGWW